MNTNPDDTSSVPTSVSDAQWRALRNLVHCLSISVLIITGTLFVFLYRQVVLIRRNTAEMAQYLRQYENSDIPELIERIRQRLDAHRQQDPGFNPIYQKYFGTNSPRPSARSPLTFPTNRSAEEP